MLTDTQDISEIKYCRSETDANIALKNGWQLLDFAIGIDGGARFLMGKRPMQMVDRVGLGFGKRSEDC